MLVADLPQGPVPQAQFQPRPLPATFMPMPMQMPMPVHTNSSATGALVCGIMAPVTWGLTSIPAVILGHKARAEIRRTGERGDGQAIAGLVLGWLGIGAWALFFLVFILLAAVNCRRVAGRRAPGGRGSGAWRLLPYRPWIALRWPQRREESGVSFACAFVLTAAHAVGTL